MGEVVPIGGAPEKKAPTAGQALFAAIVDEFDVVGVTLPRAVVAVAAKHGTQALADGVEPGVVLAGCISAIRQGKQRYTADIINDLVLHKAGMYQNREDYRRSLAQYKQDTNPVLQNMLGMMRQQRDADKRPKLTRGTSE